MLFNRKLTEGKKNRMRKKLSKMSDEELKTLINDMLERGGSGIFFSPETREAVVELAREELKSR